VKLSLCLTNYALHHECVWVSGCIDPHFLDLVISGGEWSASRSGRFTPRETAPGTHWIGSWVGPRTGLDDVEKRKFPTLPGLELRTLGRQLLASRHTNYASPAPNLTMIYRKIDFVCKVKQSRSVVYEKVCAMCLHLFLNNVVFCLQRRHLPRSTQHKNRTRLRT
jgi:hypothetical protein